MSNYLQHSADLNISAAGVFSNSHFKRVLNESEYSFLDKKIRKYKHILRLQKNNSRNDALSSLYAHLLSKYRCEYIYKNFITKNILLGKHNLNTSTLINEFRVGSSLADIVLINGTSAVYEIKTELDSPDRLSDQLADYQKAFSKIYLVIHHSQIEKYFDIVKNTSIGMLALNEKYQLSKKKKAEINIDNLDITTMFKSLRKNEYTSIISKVFGYFPNVPNMFYFKKCLELAQKIEAVKFHQLMNCELKKRKPKEKEILTSGKIPDYLSNICLAIDPSEEQYHRLFKYLNQKIE